MAINNPFSAFHYRDPQGVAHAAPSAAAVPGQVGYTSEAVDPATGRTPSGDAFNIFRGYRGPDGGGFGGYVPDAIDPNHLGGTATAQMPGGVGRWIDPKDVTAEDIGPIDFTRANQAAADRGAADALAATNAPPSYDDYAGRNDSATAPSHVITPKGEEARMALVNAASNTPRIDTADPFAPFASGITQKGAVTPAAPANQVPPTPAGFDSGVTAAKPGAVLTENADNFLPDQTPDADGVTGLPPDKFDTPDPFGFGVPVAQSQGFASPQVVGAATPGGGIGMRPLRPFTKPRQPPSTGQYEGGLRPLGKRRDAQTPQPNSGITGGAAY